MIQHFRSAWRRYIAETLYDWVHERGIPDSIHESQRSAEAFESLLPAEVPPKPEMGDIAFPLFAFSRLLKMGPPQIVSIMVPRLETGIAAASSRMGFPLGEVSATGPYINVRFDRAAFAKLLFSRLEEKGDTYGNTDEMAGQRILVEFSSPNTNKPLHLGHLRNNALGESTSRILRAAGAAVKKVNLFNDRGIHICKSMLAYKRWGNGADPKALGLKSDHYVAELYVRYQTELKKQIADLKANKSELTEADDDDIWLLTEIGAAAQELLRAWEAEDPDVRTLWQTMNSWAVDGIMETYRKTGVSFDWIQYEHETYLYGKEEVLRGLDRGVFFKKPDGAVAVELPWKDGTKTGSGEEEKNAQKVVLRSDGTSIYLTQDLGTAIRRNEMWPFDQAVYVVANEQDYHFKVLFHCLKQLGYPWAERLRHLSYGLVNLPTGRMKTREGTVVDADVLLEELAAGATEEIKAKGRDDEVADVRAVSFDIALGALHYFLLQSDPAKDMIFNPVESLNFNGNTGPYLQYMGARISSMIRKWDKKLPDFGEVDTKLLVEDQAWELLRLAGMYPETISQASRELDPSRVAVHLYELGKAFARFYHDLPVITASDPATASARLALSRAVLIVLRHGFQLLNIPFLQAM